MVEPDLKTSEAPLRETLAETVVLFGLGLIGGSIARATRRAWPKARLVGVDRAVILDVARDDGIIDEGFEPERAAEAIEGADLVVLSLPVLSIVEVLEEHAERLKEGPVVTDTGSTKRKIADAAARLGLRRFIGGHPMAGKPTAGLAHADADLFAGATWFLCPEDEADPEALRLLRQWVRELGARPVEIDAAEHDRAVALTSHVPHLVANALAETVLEMGALDAAGGSLREVLRIAGAPFDTWGDTLATNRTAVGEALAELIGRLEALRNALDDRDRLRDLFARGRALRERLGPKG